MAKWIHRTELTGASVDINGTSSHTCTFTPATAGNYLVAIVAGSLTFTVPDGWVSLSSAEWSNGWSSVHAFGKVATSGESSFTTTHNYPDMPMLGVVYELPAGTTWLGGGFNSAVVGGGAQLGPGIPGLSGNYTVFAARVHLVTQSTGSIDVTWTAPNTEDYEASIGLYSGLSVAYQDDVSGSTFLPSYFISWDGTAADTGQAIAVALYIPDVAPPAVAVNALYLGGGKMKAAYLGDVEVHKIYLGDTIVYGLPEVSIDMSTLYMSPDTGSATIGESVSIAIRVDSGTRKVNTVQADIDYPADLLTFQSIDYSGSPFTTVIQESHSAGDLRVGVGLLNGSTTGDQLIATVTFTVIAAGTAVVTFASSSGVADFATGSDVLDQATGATYDLS